MRVLDEIPREYGPPRDCDVLGDIGDCPPRWRSHLISVECGVIHRTIHMLLGTHKSAESWEATNQLSKAQNDAGMAVPAVVVRDFEEGCSGEVVFLSPARREQWTDWGIVRHGTQEDVRRANEEAEKPFINARARRKLSGHRRRLAAALAVRGERAAKPAGRWRPEWIDTEPPPEPERYSVALEPYKPYGKHDPNWTLYNPWTMFHSVARLGHEWPPDYPPEAGFRMAFFGDACGDNTRCPMIPEPMIYAIPRSDEMLCVYPIAEGTIYLRFRWGTYWPIDLDRAKAHLCPGFIDGKPLAFVEAAPSQN